MKRIKFKYDYLVFLCAFLRNVDLSLDRSRWGEWKDIQNYYDGFISPISAAKSLQDNSQIVDLNRTVYLQAESENFSRLRKLFYLFFPLKTLSEGQVRVCFGLLLQADKFLKSDIKQYTIEVEKLRILIADYYLDILKFRLKPKDFSRISSVEHYLENIQTFKITDLTKDIKIMYQSAT